MQNALSLFLHRVLLGVRAEEAKGERDERRDDEHDEHGVLERADEELHQSTHIESEWIIWKIKHKNWAEIEKRQQNISFLFFSGENIWIWKLVEERGAWIWTNHAKVSHRGLREFVVAKLFSTENNLSHEHTHNF